MSLRRNNRRLTGAVGKNYLRRLSPFSHQRAYFIDCKDAAELKTMTFPDILQRETKEAGSFLTLPCSLTTQYYFISKDALHLIKFPIDGNIFAPQKNPWEQDFSPIL